PRFTVYYRTTTGLWKYWASSPRLNATSSYAQASWVTPPAPSDATAISIALSLQDVGFLSMDDFGLADVGAATIIRASAPSASYSRWRLYKRGMVLRGQFLERPAVIEVGAPGELVIEGLYHRGERSPPLLICPPREDGAGMDAPPVAELAWAAAQAGHASLRF